MGPKEGSRGFKETWGTVRHNSAVLGQAPLSEESESVSGLSNRSSVLVQVRVESRSRALPPGVPSSPPISCYGVRGPVFARPSVKVSSVAGHHRGGWVLVRSSCGFLGRVCSWCWEFRSGCATTNCWKGQSELRRWRTYGAGNAQ